MKLKRKSVILISLAFAMLSATLGIQSMRVMASTTRTVGVNINDWANYSAFADGNATILNTTDIPVSFKITIVGINGTNVTCQESATYLNGTQMTSPGYIDVDSGNGNMSGFIIAANLNQGDLVYNGSWSFSGAIINETIPARSYLGSDWEINHMNLTNQVGIPGYWANYSWNFYWFRGSGMMAEMALNFTYLQSGTLTWLYEHITITSAVPEFSASVILPLFMALSIVAIVIVRKRLLRNST